MALFSKDYLRAKTAMEDYIRFYPDDPMSGQWRMFIPNIENPTFQKQIEEMLAQAQKDPQAALEQAFSSAQETETQGNVEMAKTIYRQIVQGAPGTEIAKKAQARLDALGDK
ncbi:MAG: hypothetical protein HY720_28350 [Planctomycetes bacterium]|nr:hypothetical protein [Planctomycetota bacterium]